MVAAVMSVDVEDWFQVENLRPRIARDSWPHRELRVERNTDRILRIFDDTRTRATFFCLGWVAERLPALVRRIAAQGHEVASHGYAHRLIYEQSPREFAEDVNRARKLLEDIGGARVIGYRAPSFSITDWSYPILAQTGHRYDSSVFPVSGHDRYGRPAHQDTAGIVELPLATAEVGGRALPWAGGGWFRLYPGWLFRAGFRRIVRQAHPARPPVFYLHPWEVDPGQPRVHGLPYGYRLRHYVNLERTAERLETLCRSVRFVRADETLPVAQLRPTPA